MQLANILKIDSNDSIVITGQSVLAPTGISSEEVFKNQLEGKANNRFVQAGNFSSMQALKKELLKSRKDHPILRNGMTEEEAEEAIEKLIELGGGLPSQVNGAVSHNGEVLNDAGLVSLIIEKLGETELSEEYKTTVSSNVKKGKFDPAILHSIYMSITALNQAGMLGEEGVIDTSTSVNLGHGFAGLRNVERDGMIGGLVTGNKMAMGPKHLVGSLPNMTSPIVANILRINAGATVDDEACAAAGYAYNRAILQIASGETDVAVAGGGDGVSDSLYAISAFGRMGALSRGYSENPNEASRPFAKPLSEDNSKGFVLGDGGGVSVLELQSHAEKRGVDTLAKISGIGSSTCNPMHVEGAGLSSGTSQGQSLAMENALASHGITPKEFVEQGGVVFAHGTSTEAGDTIEANSINNVFGSKVTVTATKGVLGHSLGGSSAQSIAIGVSSFVNNIIPGTLNYSDETRMDGIPDLNILSENKNGAAKYILVNAFGFGGHNVSILLENPEK